MYTKITRIYYIFSVVQHFVSKNSYAWLNTTKYLEYLLSLYLSGKRPLENGIGRIIVCTLP